MKAVLLSAFGDANQLNLQETCAPALGPGKMRIRVHASGLNRADIVQRKGHYPPPIGESDILGLEVAGEISELASDVRDWKVGERVMALLAGGGYAEEVTVNSGLVMPIPASLSFVEAAAIPEVFLTAHHNLFTMGAAQAGEAVLIHAGASGVGTAGIQLLRAAGARVLVTVGNAEKVAACRELGATAIDYKTQDFAAVVKTETEGKGVSVILDPVGASHWEKNFACLATGARWVFIGTMSGSAVTLDIRQLMGKRARLIGSTLRALPLTEKQQVVARFRPSLSLFNSGELRPIVDKVFPATEVRAAHQRMEGNHNIGKIILHWK